MSKKLRIVLAQLNSTVGDIDGNLKKHLQAIEKAKNELNANVIVFPELSLTGYPPEDLLLRKDFLAKAQLAIQTLIDTVKDIYCVISHPHQTTEGLFNACSIVYNGAILARYAKQHLPNYGVFDEDRYFIPGNAACVVPMLGIPVGIVICEDLWFPGPVQQVAAMGARVILSPNASPFEIDKHDQRVAVLSKRIKQDRVPVVYVNSVGGQDELIFDGGSMVVDDNGQICQFAGFFNETLLPVDIEITASQTQVATIPFTLPSQEQKIYDALVLSVRDYIEKNHFPGVYVGVSGGIDSALTLAIAVDALGPDRVQAIFMPTVHTSEISHEEATAITTNLGIPLQTIPIDKMVQEVIHTLKPIFHNDNITITEQNIQARCRAILLMALSNQYGSLVLPTGNRSEIAVGYCTLYGDMAGGFSVLKDVPKTLVYKLSEYRNANGVIIPKRTIEREPTAELAPNQKDQDTLPPYSILDPILYAYLNQGLSVDEIIAQGYNADTVHRIIRLIKQNEYKRRQSAIGPRINVTSFGKDWRYPVTVG